MSNTKREELFLVYCVECGTVQVQPRGIAVTLCHVCKTATNFAPVALEMPDNGAPRFFTITPIIKLPVPRNLHRDEDDKPRSRR